ncbi:hypothetical protein HDU98_008853 [Podochytrium sp. JEL0797]|nr:hypothetical protein HDU98_008844 [Podochytrium sp. JEL0797]KAJ3075246.1 hypothetical protein HDU98_008853 [Podochytrium sp. JEL0797]
MQFLRALALSLLALCASADTPAYEVKDDELHWIEHFSLSTPFVDTFVNVNSFVRITPNRQSMRGWLWARMPIVTQKSWVVEFEFKVHGGERLFGDGFAFWYTTDRKKIGDVFGNQDEFNGLGVFFDTYTNGRNRAIFPYINAMLGDGQTKYDQSTDGKSNEIGGCTAHFRDRDYVTRAKVVYLENKMIQVFIDVDGQGTWRECLTKNDVTLPERGYFGFTSHTGDASDNHDILRVTSYSIENEHTSKPEPPKPGDSTSNKGGDKSYNTPDRDAYRKPAAPIPTAVPQSAKKSNSSFVATLGYTLLVLFVVVAVGAVGFVLYGMWKKTNSPKSYKRF